MDRIASRLELERVLQEATQEAERLERRKVLYSEYGEIRVQLRTIALLKLEGHTNDEIAARIGRSVPTVERRLRLIRQTWKEERV